MNRTLSTQQVRLVLLLGLLFVCIAGWWIIAKQSSQTTSPATPQARPVPAHATTVAPAPVRSHPTPAPVTKLHKDSPVTSATKPVATAHTGAKPINLATHGLPLTVAQALHKHRVVVVALYTPGAVIDKLARAESHAGAVSIGAGFVALDVLRQKDGAPLLRKLGVMSAPAVLVVTQHGKIYAQFEGFVDRKTVEQAVADARG